MTAGTGAIWPSLRRVAARTGLRGGNRGGLARPLGRTSEIRCFGP